MAPGGGFEAFGIAVTGGIALKGAGAVAPPPLHALRAVTVKKVAI